MADTYITRRQFDELVQRALPGFRSGEDILNACGIRVCRDETGDAETLGDATICNMAARHGCHIALDVSARDMLERFPWLSRAECDAVAQRAAENLGESSHASDQRSDSIDLAMEEEGLRADLDELDEGEEHTDSMGRVWRLVGYEHGAVRLSCEDPIGKVTYWEETGTEWEMVEPEQDEAA